MTCISVAANAACCLLVVRGTSAAWVSYRNHIAGISGHTKQLDASGGAWYFYVSVSDDMGLGWLMSCVQTQVQPGTEVPQKKKYCWHKAVSLRAGKKTKGREKRKEIISTEYLQFFTMHSFIAIIPSYYQLRLKGFFSWRFLFPLLFSFPVSCQYFVPSGHSKLWFRKIVLVFSPGCPGFPNLSCLAFRVVANCPEPVTVFLLWLWAVFPFCFPVGLV